MHYNAPPSMPGNVHMGPQKKRRAGPGPVRPKKKRSGTASPTTKRPLAHATAEPPSRRNTGWTCFLALGTVILLCSSIILGVLVLVGCVSTNANIDRLYLTEFRENKTVDIQLRVGYFGGCVLVTGLQGQESPIAGVSADNQTADVQHCVPNLRDKDIEDLAEEMTEDLNLTESARTLVEHSLNGTLLPLARHVQVDLFPWGPPVAYFALFILATVVMLTSIASFSHRRSYKAVLLFAILVAALSLGLAFSMAIRFPRVLNAVMDGTSDTITVPGGDNTVYITRGRILGQLLAGLTAVTALFYLFIGVAIIRRGPSGANVFGFGSWRGKN